MERDASSLDTKWTAPVMDGPPEVILHIDIYFLVVEALLSLMHHQWLNAVLRL
jgi:hypothetical protein